MAAVVEVAGTPAGTVAAETPTAGNSLPAGSPVILEVRRKSSESTKAPNAVGLSPEEASTAFGSLYVLEFVPKPGEAKDRGKIVEQSPKMGDAVELRGVLRLSFVADDTLPESVATPDVSGMSAAEATKAMAEAGSTRASRPRRCRALLPISSSDKSRSRARKPTGTKPSTSS